MALTWALYTGCSKGGFPKGEKGNLLFQQVIQTCILVFVHWQNDENVSLQDIMFSVPSSPEPQEPESTFKVNGME